MSDFPKPLDQDLIEEQEVENQVITPTGETDADGTPKFKIERVKEKVEIITRYTRAVPRFFSCKEGTHKWVMVDRHKHIAKCATCPKHRYLRAAYETIDPDGHLIDRDTRTIID